MADVSREGVAFDAYASQYDRDLHRGLALSGERKDYFAQQRVRFLAGQLERAGVRPRRVLDFGCGTGTAVPHLLAMPGVEHVVGVDPSRESVAIASAANRSARACFDTLDALPVHKPFDLIYCNGVFHHIPPDQRPGSLRLIRGALRAGGYFSLWENNPWNPGTRWVMRRIPFDRDAVTLSVWEARRLLRGAGLTCTSSRFLFIFPRTLRWLRPLEGPLSRWPIGAQYMVLSLKGDPAPSAEAPGGLE
ncbi:MAG TPA: class I SAM-dependent methyltransferase [Humisphaera sp.]